MTADYRAMCAELAKEVEHLWSIVRDDNNEPHPLANRARALLAQPEPQPPVAGEVAAALIELRSTVMGLDQMKMYVAAQRVKRAADLLERQHPQPVAVSERLPGPEDCDAGGMCWWWRSDGIEEFWELTCVPDPISHNSKCAENVSYGPWLPAHALPNPETTND